jgi:glucose-6-phosphate-specific signal transduction histidine kinase
VSNKSQRSTLRLTICHALCRRTFLRLFRVLQEALHNSAKYSGARHFSATWGTSDEIHLTVGDFGAGFHPSGKAAEGLASSAWRSD